MNGSIIMCEVANDEHLDDIDHIASQNQSYNAKTYT